MGPTRPRWSAERTIEPYGGAVETIYTADNAPDAPAVDALEQVESITQYGITWTFEQPVRAGQFVTGDWYIVGPATVVEIDPKPLFGDEVKDHPDWELIDEGAVREKDRHEGRWARHGSTLNQRTDTHNAGYDSRIAGGYYDHEQFMRGPIEMTPGDSLISTISAPDPLRKYSGHGQPVLAAAVLTCLDAPVPADAFRPSYVDRENRIYLARNLRRELLHSLPRPSSAPPHLEEWARAFERPWLDTVRWGYANPAVNSPRYGQLMVNNVSHAALLLHLDYSPIEKEPLLVHYVQYGIDLGGILRSDGQDDIYRGHGGFGGGRKWPLVFTGLMLDDSELRRPSVTRPEFEFGEDTQTSWGEPWSGGKVAFESHPAWRPEPQELEHPREWEKFGNENYRRCCTSEEWPGQALAAMIMRAEQDWDYDPFFAYVDRWMTEDHIAQLKVLKEVLEGRGDRFPPFNQRAIDRNEYPLTSPLMQEMWDTYRHDLPPPREPSGASGASGAARGQP